MKYHLLLLEDDTSLARLTCDILQDEGYMVSWCSNALRAIQLLQEQHVDLILCDVLLPGMSGFEFVKAIREQFEGPILFMTAQTKNQQQLQGFELGAQDYLLKPVDPRILLAKLRVQLQPKTQTLNDVTLLQHFNLQVDLQSRTASIAGQPVDLTSAEFKLLAALSQQFGKVVSRDWLFKFQLGRQYDGSDRTMDGRVSRLRRKLQAYDVRWTIVTAWGEGYYLCYEGAPA